MTETPDTPPADHTHENPASTFSRDDLLAMLNIAGITPDSVATFSDGFLAGALLAIAELAAADWRHEQKEHLRAHDDVSGYSTTLLGMIGGWCPEAQHNFITHTLLYGIMRRREYVERCMIPATPEGHHNKGGAAILNLVSLSLAQAGMGTEMTIYQGRAERLMWVSKVASTAKMVHHGALALEALIEASDDPEEEPETPQSPQGPSESVSAPA